MRLKTDGQVKDMERKYEEFDFKPKGIQLRHYFYLIGALKLTGLLYVTYLLVT
jgi:hypothetical protein